jgi:hypothetical protein
MVKLPFIPAPYPDEILGSWLARVSLHNGSGCWRVLLEETGFGRRMVYNIFDLPPHSTKLENLLNALGINYDIAITTLTTYSYWSTFDADLNVQRALQGAPSSPALRRRTFGPSDRVLNRLWIANKFGETFQPLYCPECLRDDFDVYGGLYWHRSHQLPNVFVCGLHQCTLLDACPKCGLVVAPINRRLFDLPRPVCSCGQDLRLKVNPVMFSDAYLRLSRISCQALNMPRPTWDRLQVKSYFRSTLQELGATPPQAYLEVIQKTFDVCKSFADIGCDYIETKFLRRLRFSREFKNIRAPDCCALLVALGIGLERASHGFQCAQVSEKKIPFSYCETIDSARRKIEREHQKHPNRKLHSFGGLYWYLRIYDTAWLASRFDLKKLFDIPSVFDDRKKLSKMLDIVWSLKASLSSPAYFRARCRDSVWLAGLVAERKLIRQEFYMARSKPDSSRVVFNEVMKARIPMMEEALRRALRDEKRPTHIYANTLGALVGLSHGQALWVIKVHPPLKEAINEANAGKYRRQLIWSLRQLQAEGSSINLTKLLANAGLPSTRSMSQLGKDVLKELMQ